MRLENKWEVVLLYQSSPPPVMSQEPFNVQPIYVLDRSQIIVHFSSGGVKRLYKCTNIPETYNRHTFYLTFSVNSPHNNLPQCTTEARIDKCTVQWQDQGIHSNPKLSTS
jgi:hypothetical protein